MSDLSEECQEATFLYAPPSSVARARRHETAAEIRRSRGTPRPHAPLRMGTSTPRPGNMPNGVAITVLTHAPGRTAANSTHDPVRRYGHGMQPLAHRIRGPPSWSLDGLTARPGPQSPAGAIKKDKRAADGNHPYELSHEGVLSVAPAADSGHAMPASRNLRLAAVQRLQLWPRGRRLRHRRRRGPRS